MQSKLYSINCISIFRSSIISFIMLWKCFKKITLVYYFQSHWFTKSHLSFLYLFIFIFNFFCKSTPVLQNFLRSWRSHFLCLQVLSLYFILFFRIPFLKWFYLWSVSILFAHRSAQKMVQPTMVFGRHSFDSIWSSSLTQGLWEGMIILEFLEI